VEGQGASSLKKQSTSRVAGKDEASDQKHERQGVRIKRKKLLESLRVKKRQVLNGRLIGRRKPTALRGLSWSSRVGG